MKSVPGLRALTPALAPAVAAVVAAAVAAAPARAQQAASRISGVITDSAGGRPVPSVQVSLVGTRFGAVTDAEGRYAIAGVPAGTYQLRVQRIGFAPRTRPVVVAGGSPLTVSLALSANSVQLQEVVAVGYGTQRLRDVTGSVAAVNLEATQRAPIATVDQLLQGTAPGVQVTTASSEPGGAISIRIRGNSSITGSGEPLYVIDGFPVENDIEGSAVGNGGRSRTTPPNPLVTLNPSDIESISILKDASATAIYGARGANGVVIITTKQGRGTRPVFGLDAYTGSQTVAKRYDLLDAAGYMDYANAFAANSSTPYVPFPDSTRARILAAGINTDWQDLVFRTGATQNLQLSARGATNNANPTRYNVSGGVFDQTGIVVGSGLRRLSARANLNQSAGNRFELGSSLFASQARSRATPTGGQQNANAGSVSAALQYVPVLPVTRADGSYSLINPDLNVYNSLLDAPQTPNPVSLTNEVRDSLSDSRLLGNFFVNATVLPGLQARVSVGGDYANRGRFTYYPRTTLRGQQAGGDAIRAGATTTSWLNENTLTYQRQFGRIHDLTLLGGYSRQATTVDGETISNSNFANDITGYFDIGSGTQQGGASVGSRNTRQTLESFLGRLNYNLLDRYLLTATVRQDGSSRFAANRKRGTFPSYAVAWRASSEPFLRDLRRLDELKVRYSYGAVGNPSIRPYQSLARLSAQGYSFGGTTFSGYYPVAVANPELSWETTRQHDVGFDVGFLGRFTAVADYYKKRTTNLLLSINLPLETGFQSALANRGTVDNAGFEFSLDTRVVGGGKNAGANDFSWRAAFNYATNRTRVVDLGPGTTRIFADFITTDFNLPGSVIQVGQPLGAFYGFKSTGLIKTAEEAARIFTRNFNNQAFRAGDMGVVDLDGDGVITLNDRTTVGDPTPRYTVGLTNTFGWRGVELTGLLQGSVGGKILNVNRIRTEGSPRVNIVKDRWYDAWSPTNPDGKYARVGENPNQVGTNNFTDNLLEDGTFFRLRTLTLSTAVPRRLLRVPSTQPARLYVTGVNLFTITDYSGFDPDVSSQSVGAQNRGIDIGAYPLAKGFTVGLNFSY